MSRPPEILGVDLAQPGADRTVAAISRRGVVVAIVGSVPSAQLAAAVEWARRAAEESGRLDAVQLLPPRREESPSVRVLLGRLKPLEAAQGPSPERWASVLRWFEREQAARASQAAEGAPVVE